jgi:type VI protein secretion system component VasK
MKESRDTAINRRKKELELETLQKQIEDLEKRIARPADEGIRHYNAFDFFTGFLKASIIVTVILAVPACFYCGISNFLYKSGNTDYANSGIKAFLFLVGVFALIHLVGGFIARKRRDENNKAADFTIAANLKRKETLKKELEDLEEQYAQKQNELRSYCDTITGGSDGLIT